MVEENFGEQVVTARKARGWSQEELADRVGVGQQAVSGWERGKTKPGPEVHERLWEVLGLADGQTSRPAIQWGPPRQTRLPFTSLSEYQFEAFAADLMEALYPGASVSQFGTRGETQYGIDVRVITQSGDRVGIQCKHILKFQPAALDKAVAALNRAEAKVDRCILFLTSTASVNVQRKAADLAEWEIWDVDTLSRKVYHLPPEAALRIVDRYFPGLRGPFLGINTPSPWETPEEAFDRFAQGDRYSQRWTLVGRTAELEGLRAFARGAGADAASRFGVVVGSAGSGKTRLLKALCEELASDGSIIFRIASREPVRPEDFALLPRDGLVLIVDDVHEHVDDLRTLIGGVLRECSGAKILMATRPYGVRLIDEVMRGLGVDSMTIPNWEVGELSTSEAVALATEVLGSPSRSVAERLAGAVGDCPLLLVAGAVQIRDGKLSTRLLVTDGQTRLLVSRAFLESALAAGTDDDALSRSVLQAVALLQPFRENVPAFQDSLAGLTGQRFHIVAPYLRALEEKAGVLLRRGSSLRIVPDLLGDVVLADAAVLPSSGASTGYLEAAYEVVHEGEPLLHAFVNASRLDWQWRLDNPAAPSAIAPLWGSIEATVRNAGDDSHAAYVPFLRRVAPFQPSRVLGLIRWLRGHRQDGGAKLELGTVLEGIAYDLDCFSDVCDLLWDLGRWDARALHATPEHPLRILKDLSSYKPGKSTEYQMRITQIVQRWVETGHSASVHARMPLELLDPIFESQAEWTTRDGWNVTIRRGEVTHKRVQNLRRRALDVIYSELSASDEIRSVKAARTFEDVLRKSNSIGEEYTLELLDGLDEKIKKVQLGPLTALAIRRSLKGHRAYGSIPVKERAEELIGAIGYSREYDLAKVLLSAWWAEPRRGGISDHEAEEALWQNELSRVAAECSKFGANELYLQIEQLIDQGCEAFDSQPEEAQGFLEALMQCSPELAEPMCENAIVGSERVQRAIIPTCLGTLLRLFPQDGMRMSNLLIAQDDVSKARMVGSALSQRRSNDPVPLEVFKSIGQKLALHDDAIVRRFAVRAAWNLDPIDHKSAVELIASVPFRGDANVAEAFSEAVTIFRWFGWSELSEEEVGSILAQLVEIDTIEKYEIQKLLSMLSNTEPEAILDLLLNRVDYWSVAENRQQFAPLPYHWHFPFSFGDSRDRLRFLRKIHGWVASPDADSRSAAHRSHLGPEIFSLVSGDYDSEVRDLFLDWIRSAANPDKKAAATLLRGANKDLLWREVSFIAKMLQHAELVSDGLYREVAGSLYSVNISGVRSGTPGEPYAEDIESRDRASAILATLEPGSAEARFYTSLESHAEQMISWSIDIDRTEDGRDW